jgi:hypothetical protein
MGHYIEALYKTSRRVLSWRLSNALTTDSCIEAVQEAIHRYGTPDAFYFAIYPRWNRQRRGQTGLPAVPPNLPRCRGRRAAS